MWTTILRGGAGTAGADPVRLRSPGWAGCRWPSAATNRAGDRRTWRWTVLGGLTVSSFLIWVVLPGPGERFVGGRNGRTRHDPQAAARRAHRGPGRRMRHHGPPTGNLKPVTCRGRFDKRRPPTAPVGRRGIGDEVRRPQLATADGRRPSQTISRNRPGGAGARLRQADARARHGGCGPCCRPWARRQRQYLFGQPMRFPPRLTTAPGWKQVTELDFWGQETATCWISAAKGRGPAPARRATSSTVGH